MKKFWPKKFTVPQLVVRPRLAPRTKLLLGGGGLTVLVLAAGWFYNYGLSMAGFDRSLANRQQEKLQEEIHRHVADNKELRQALARAERSLQMNETAFQELDRSLKASSQEVVKLREELNFYRNIISPADKKSGLRIQNLFVEPAGTGHFRYKLVLIQALKHEHTIQGSASFEIAGQQAGQEVVVAVPGSNERPIKVSFRYFQDLEGKFQLPKDFTPERIKVQVRPAGTSQSIEQSYAWPRA